MKISYRETTNEDYEFCEAIHHSGMRPYVEPIWGWDEKFQKERYKRLWIPENIKIILHENMHIGYIEVIETEEQVKLSNIFIIDKFRGNGVGSKVVTDFIDNYKDRTACLTLNVLWNNPAKGLYERLGFKFIRQEDQILRYEFSIGKHKSR